MKFMLAIILLVEEIGELRTDLFIVRIPRARPRCALAALPFHRVTDVGAVFPSPETCLQPVRWCAGAVSLNSLAQDRGAGFTLLGSTGVKPGDVVVG